MSETDGRIRSSCGAEDHISRRVRPQWGGRVSPQRWGAILALALLATALLPAGVVNGSPWLPRLALTDLSAAEANKPPKVTKQPVNVTVEAGQSATFTSTASGVPTPTVQWEVSTDQGASWSLVEGATASSYTIAMASVSENGDEFRAVFRNIAGEATSKVVALEVRRAPTVTGQPASITVEEGQNAIFEATASGFPAPSVKWEISANGGATWSGVAGGTSDQLTIVSVKRSISGREYRATFRNAAGEATSEAATLTVQKRPAVTQQPESITVDEGQSALFEAAASGFPTPAVQWEMSTDGGETWNAIEGATSDQLTIASAQVSEDGNQYRAAFQNAAGSAISQPATLTVHAPPLVTEQPAGAIVEVGESASFSAMASGFPAPTIQWEISTDGGKTWSALAGATAASIAIEKTQVSENGDEYRAVFTNPAGKVTSAVATLTVATTKYGAAAWGENVFGELGDGSNEASSDAPVPVTGLGFVTAVAAGGHHSLALLADGAVLAWGAGGYGQLGDGSLTASNVPVAVQGLSTVKAISAGANHSLALLDNGTVMAWGDNESGQLGIGGASERVDTPVLVKGLTGVKAISAGANYSLALLSNGTVMAWGENESGQLGNGDTSASSVPVAVKRLSAVSAISAGGEFSLALLNSGTVEAWGNDAQHQLANKTVEEGFASTPVPVESLAGVAAITAGADHGLALVSGGTVMAWGADSFGELGNGEVKPNEGTPVAVTGLSDVTAISAGTHDSAALLGSGSVMTWGTNQSGVLGVGIPDGFSDVPVSVIGLTKAASISDGASHMLAYGEPIPAVTAVSPPLGPVAGGNTVVIAGTDFTGATAVSFGATEAASFTVDSPTSITATAPAGTGTVDVTVTTPAGRSAAGASDRYTFQARPTIVRLAAKSGPVAGGTIVTITGTEFTGSTNVSFGHTSATEFEVHSPSSITAIVPPEAAGIVDVTVTNTVATSATTTSDHFKYLPVLGSLAPNLGSTLGGTSVTVTGEGFALGSTATIFKFGTLRAHSVNCTSSTTCTLITPAEQAGTVNVKATVNKATSAVNGVSDQFTYE